jgi:hypothetical protein
LMAELESWILPQGSGELSLALIKSAFRESYRDRKI